MGFLTVFILLIIIALIAYIAITGGSQLCGLAFINLFCKCKSSVAGVSGGDPDGKCWACPKINGSQTLRTGDAVTTNTACGGNCTTMYKNGFPDIIDGGTCWSCPSGYHRSAGPAVTAVNACELNNCSSKWPGSFWDSENGGECWTCPSNLPCRNNALPVSSPNACGGCTIGGPSAPAKFMGKTTTTATNNGPYRFPATISKMRLF
jgi:hypothetical protein